MPATYEPIASQTLGSDVSEVTFSSIPGTFTDLVVVAQTRTSEAATVSGLGLRLNGTTSTGFYSVTRLQGSGSAASSGRDSASTETQSNGGVAPGNTATSNVFGTTVLHVMSYANANVFKTVLWQSDDGAQSLLRRSVTLFQSTSAITSLTLRPGAGNLKSGSTVSLFGLKAA